MLQCLCLYTMLQCLCLYTMLQCLLQLQRMSPETLLINCKSYADGVKPPLADATECRHEKIVHNASHQNGRYTYNQTIERAIFYRVVLLQCPDIDRNDTIKTTDVRSCQVGLIL